eukprot:762082-Hanusia_phi.AAC.2
MAMEGAVRGKWGGGRSRGGQEGGEGRERGQEREMLRGQAGSEMSRQRNENEAQGHWTQRKEMIRGIARRRRTRQEHSIAEQIRHSCVCNQNRLVDMSNDGIPVLATAHDLHGRYKLSTGSVK